MSRLGEFARDPQHRADGALLLVTIFWGLTFPLIRAAVEDLAPSVFVLARFGVATLAFIPLLLLARTSRQDMRDALPSGLALGLLAWASYFAQTIGLTTVEAGRAAFITGTNVVLVPLMSPLFGAGRPSRLEVLAALLATLGLYLLCDPRAGGFSIGDAWILLCAVLYAVYVHALQRVLRRGYDTLALTGSQIFGVALCALAYLPFSGAPAPNWTRQAVSAVLLCALLATVGTFWLQTHFQGRTTPQRVALIFALEPVFATGFAYLLLGELLSPLGQLGAGIILIAVVGVELVSPPKERAAA